MRGRTSCRVAACLLVAGLSLGGSALAAQTGPLKEPRSDESDENLEVSRLVSSILTIYPEGVLIPMRGVRIVTPTVAPERRPAGTRLELVNRPSPFDRVLLTPRRVPEPAQYGAPLHRELVFASTPPAFRTPAVFSVSVGTGWPGRRR